MIAGGPINRGSTFSSVMPFPIVINEVVYMVHTAADCLFGSARNSIANHNRLYIAVRRREGAAGDERVLLVIRMANSRLVVS